MVSVIIPTFNAENYVLEAIESVFRQTYQNFEIIVVNDGSNDNTEGLLRRYLDKITYIYQENRGVAAARNVGIRASKGQYLAFLDSDDIWLPNKLQLQIDYFRNNPNIALVYADYFPFDNTGIVTNHFSILSKRPRPTGYIYQFLLRNTLFGTSTVMLRRSTLDSVGLFDETFFKGEDYELWLRIAATHRVGFLARTVVGVRQHPDSLTKAPKELGMPWEIRAIEKATQLFPDKTGSFSTHHKKRRFSQIYLSAGYSAFQRTDYSLAKHYFRKSVRILPFNINAFFYYFCCMTWPQLWNRLILIVKRILSSAG